MAGSTVVKIGSGTMVYYEPSASFGAASANWIQLVNIVSIGDVGSEGSFTEATPLSAVIEENIAGLSTTPEMSIDFQDLPGNTAYQTFLTTEVNNKTSVRLKINYPTNRSRVISLQLGGEKVLNPGSERLILQVSAKQSGGHADTII